VHVVLGERVDLSSLSTISADNITPAVRTRTGREIGRLRRPGGWEIER
jgi:hypothetical protein